MQESTLHSLCKGVTIKIKEPNERLCYDDPDTLDTLQSNHNIEKKFN